MSALAAAPDQSGSLTRRQLGADFGHWGDLGNPLKEAAAPLTAEGMVFSYPANSSTLIRYVDHGDRR
jgi:hypothetical protein